MAAQFGSHHRIGCVTAKRIFVDSIGGMQFGTTSLTPLQDMLDDIPAPGNTLPHFFGYVDGNSTVTVYPGNSDPTGMQTSLYQNQGIGSEFDLSQVEGSVSVLTYTGTSAITACIYLRVFVTCTNVNTTTQVSVVKNGGDDETAVTVASTRVPFYVSDTFKNKPGYIQAITSLSPNDTLMFKIANLESSEDMTVTNAQCVVHALL